MDQLERLRKKAVLLRKEKSVYRTPLHPDCLWPEPALDARLCVCARTGPCSPVSREPTSTPFSHSARLLARRRGGGGGGVRGGRHDRLHKRFQHRLR